jgi:predicted aconitase with swiveling domain
MDVIMSARAISRGTGTGPLLVSAEPISFLSGVDPETGIVVEAGHPLKGQCIAGTVLAFPFGKGSTVGSYVMYALSRNAVAPAAIINMEAEPIIAVGAIISGIPMIDHLPFALLELETGRVATVDGTSGTFRYEEAAAGQDSS